MTGRYPIHTGMQTATIYNGCPYGLGLDEHMLPQYLKNLGYQTHAVGKWHLGDFAVDYTPTRRGFDTYYGVYGGKQDYWDHSYQHEKYWGLDLHADTVNTSQLVYDQWGNYSTKMYTMEGINKIKQHDQSNPLFLYLAFNAPHSANAHDPLQPPDSWVDEWVDKFNHIEHEGRRKYANIVSYLDYSVGLVVDSLKETGMLKDSIVIFTSDNGGPADGFNYNWATNYPLRGGKANLYEGGVRAVGLIYSTLIKNSQRVSLDMMHATDWLPTLLSAAGGDSRNLTNLDGFNLWPTLKDASPSPRNEILLNIDEHMYESAALIFKNWKLVEAGNFSNGWYAPPGDPQNDSTVTESGSNTAIIKCGSKPENVPTCSDVTPCLFNITGDPCEYNDVSKIHPQVFKMMIQKLKKYKNNMVKAKFTQEFDENANPKLHNGVWEPRK